MLQFDPHFLKQWSQGNWNHLPTLPISGFTNDTRSLLPGTLFVALRGTHRDGHLFLEEAYAKGASAALVDRFMEHLPIPQLKVDHTLRGLQRIAAEYRKQFSGPIIGITGSCGKTTTKDALHHFLGSKNHATSKNLNNTLGVPLTLLNLNPAIHTSAIIEAGIDQIGEMKQLAEIIRPDLSILTSIGPVHLEGLQSLSSIAQEKSILAQAALLKGNHLMHTACLNHPAFAKLQSQSYIIQPIEKGKLIGAKEVFYYKLDHANPYEVNLMINSECMQNEHYTMPFYATGVIHNIILAIVAARKLNVSKETLQNYLKTWIPSENRGEIWRNSEQLWYADCYNSNPLALLDALEYFKNLFFKVTPHLYILGGMKALGDQSFEHHFNIGQKLTLAPQDHVILIGEEAKAFEQGIHRNKVVASQIKYMDKTDKATSFVKNFKGSIFVKGSKFYELWKLIPQTARKINLKELSIC